MFYAFLCEGVVSVCKFRYSFDGVDAVDKRDNLDFVSKGDFGDVGVDGVPFAWLSPN